MMLYNLKKRFIHLIMGHHTVANTSAEDSQFTRVNLNFYSNWPMQNQGDNINNSSKKITYTAP